VFAAMQHEPIIEQNDRTRGRHYGLDWLRIGAFQLLILYHVGMTFVPWAYYIKLATIPWVSIPMQLTSPWRLSLLFVVSGYASAALLARSGGAGAFLRQRVARLGLPLLFGMALIVAPQPWIQLVTQHGYDGSFTTFLTRDYFSWRTLGGIALPNWMHLWFVAYLLAYTILLCAALHLPSSWRRTLARAGDRLFGGPQLLVVGTAFVLATRYLLPGGWEDSHDLIHDWSAHGTYFGMFLFGVHLRKSPRTMRAIVGQWRPAAAAAIGGWLVLATLEYLYPGPRPLPERLWPLLWVARSIENWAAIVALVGIAERFANRDHPWRAMLAEAVFPFYLVHQTIILLAGYWLLGTATGPLVRFVALVAMTMAGCWAFYLATRAIDPLRPLVGLAPRKPAATVRRAAPGSAWSEAVPVAAKAP
jgi:glucan biosynthesis protein C